MPNLQLFVDAQSSTYAQAHGELSTGRKRTHWMWFIFPQIQGLGSSSTAQRYAIADLAEAVAYLNHPLLGPRLRECTALVNRIPNASLEDIFGFPDNLKFHSSVSLFAAASGDPADEFHQALELFFAGKPDPHTVARINI